MSPASIPGRDLLDNPVVVGLVLVLVLGGLGAFVSTAIVAHSDMGDGSALGIAFGLTVGGMVIGAVLTWLWFRRDPRL